MQSTKNIKGLNAVLLPHNFFGIVCHVLIYLKRCHNVVKV